MEEQEAKEIIKVAKEYFKNGDYDSAALNFEQVKKGKPSEEVYHCLAVTYSKKGAIDFAIKNYKKCLEYNPKNYKILASIGDLYTQKKNYKLALTFLNKSINLNTNYVAIHYYMGRYRYLTGDLDWAIMSFKRARSLGSKSAKLYYALGMAYKAKGEFGLCENCMKLALTKDLNNAKALRIYRSVANLAGTMKKFDRAFGAGE